MARSYAAKRVVYGAVWLAKVLAAFKVAPVNELVDTPLIRLSKKEAFLPTPTMTIATLEADEADFSGYTPGGYAAVLGGVVNLNANVKGYVVNVVPTAATAVPFVPGTVTGWWMEDATDVICAEAFEIPLTFGFGSVGDFLDLLVALPFGYYVETGM